MKALLRLFALVVMLPTMALAQTYPSQSETAVTDDAELIDPVAEAELAERLTALSQEGGADIAVVTLPSTGFYTAGDDLDVYARDLMADWGLGDTVEGRGILLLVFADDREVRIEAGGGFGPDASAIAAEIVQDTIVPAFRDEDYARGLSEAVEAIGARMLPAIETTTPGEAPVTGPDGTPAPEADTTPATATDGAGEEGGNGILLWIGGGVAAVVALIVGANRRAAAKLAETPCPNCGKTGLTRERVTLQQATEKHEGHGELRTSCPHCGHVEAKAFTIDAREPEKVTKDGSTGPAPAAGMTSKTRGGGGASGEW